MADNDDNVISFAKRGQIGAKVEPFTIECSVDEEGAVTMEIEGICSELELVGLLECAKAMILNPANVETEH